MAETVEAVTVFEGRHLRARLFRPEGRQLFVSFDSFRPGRTEFDDRGPVKYYQRRGLAQLQIQTACNDWYLNDDLEPMLEVLSDCVQPYRRVFSMAFSMGAFAALRMSGKLRLSRVFLVSPQVTPFSRRGPMDPRFVEHEAGIRADLDLEKGHLFRRMRGCVLFDPLHHRKDVEHARAILDMAPGLRAVALPLAGHPADNTLLEGKVWHEFQGLLLGRGDATAGLKALHRKSREVSPSYLEALSRRLASQGKGAVGLLRSGKGLP